MGPGGQAEVLALAQARATSVPGCVAFAMHSELGVQFYNHQIVGDLVEADGWSTYLLHHGEDDEDEDQ